MACGCATAAPTSEAPKVIEPEMPLVLRSREREIKPVGRLIAPGGRPVISSGEGELDPGGTMCGNGVLESMGPREMKQLADRVAAEDRADATDEDVTVLFDRSEFGAPSCCGRPAGNPGMQEAGRVIEAWLSGQMSAKAYVAALLWPIERPFDVKSGDWAGSADRETLRTTVAVPESCTATRIFHPHLLATSGRTSCLYLGPNPWANGGALPVLEATIPVDYVPTRSKSEMKWALWPRWMERCAPGGNPDWSRAGACVQWKGGAGPPGLFWDEGNGFEYRFLLHAIVTMHGFRTYLSSRYQFPEACGMSTTKMDDYFKRRENWVKNEYTWLRYTAKDWLWLDEKGQLHSSLYFDSKKGSAWAWAGRIRYEPEAYRINAAVADFYLWWAHRLYSYALDGGGGWLHLAMAWWCAQLAMAEIVSMCEMLVHEWGHLTGSSYHCGPGAGSAEGTNSPKSCCQYLSQVIFATRVSAEMGLPAPQQGGSINGDWRVADQVLKLPAGEVLVTSTNGTGNCYNTRGVALGFLDACLSESSPCRVDRAIPKQCVSDISPVGSQEFRGVEW